MNVRSIDVSLATKSLAEYVNESAAGPFVITREGRPVAVVMAIEGEDMETISLSTNPRFIAMIERSNPRQGREGGISSDEIRRRLGAASRKKDVV